MLYQIVSLLLEVATGLVGGMCLLRLYMQHQRVGFGNPLGQFVFAVTNWLVLPLRRVIPSAGRWDLASVVAVFVIELVHHTLLWLLAGAGGAVLYLPLMAAFGVLRLVISGLTGMLILYAVLSWVQTSSPLSDVLDRLCAPLLRPIRRRIPMVGGVDLSPLVALLLLQVAAIVLANAQGWALRAVSAL